MPERFDRAAEILLHGILDSAFPCAAVEVGRKDDVVWRRAFGTLTYDTAATDAGLGTIFDLASLTKIIATATLAMRAADDGVLALDDEVRKWLPEWRGRDRQHVTIRDLLAHSSGLPAYLPFFRDHAGRVEFEPAVCHTALEYAPGSQSVYSDLGFMLLAFIVEDARAGPARRSGRMHPETTCTLSLHDALPIYRKSVV